MIMIRLMRLDQLHSYPSQKKIRMWSKLWALEVSVDIIRYQIFHKRNISNSCLQIRATITRGEKITKFPLWLHSVEPTGTILYEIGCPPQKNETRINNYVFIKNEIGFLYHSTFILFCFYSYCTQNKKSHRHKISSSSN